MSTSGGPWTSSTGVVLGQGVHSFYFLGASIFNSLPLSLSLRNINAILRNINSNSKALDDFYLQLLL